MSHETQVTPYNGQESKKGQATRMFDAIAPYYDHLNRLLSLGIDVWWRKKAIQKLAEAKPSHILDIATGTADLAMEAAKAISPQSIIGLDISSKMLAIGQTKIEKAGLTSIIRLETGDSEQLRFENASFDAVTAAFGVRNFENLEKGLAEMYRVLKPGGTLVILEFSKPRIFPVKQLFNLYFQHFLPWIGRMRSKDEKAYKYLYESVQAFPDYSNFTAILQQIGFQHAGYEPLTTGICCIYSAKK